MTHNTVTLSHPKDQSRGKNTGVSEVPPQWKGWIRPHSRRRRWHLQGSTDRTPDGRFVFVKQQRDSRKMGGVEVEVCVTEQPRGTIMVRRLLVDTWWWTRCVHERTDVGDGVPREQGRGSVVTVGFCCTVVGERVGMRNKDNNTHLDLTVPFRFLGLSCPVKTCRRGKTSLVLWVLPLTRQTSGETDVYRVR